VEGIRKTVSTRLQAWANPWIAGATSSDRAYPAAGNHEGGPIMAV
jgi:hypothetical protein